MVSIIKAEIPFRLFKLSEKTLSRLFYRRERAQFKYAETKGGGF